MAIHEYVDMSKQSFIKFKNLWFQNIAYRDVQFCAQSLVRIFLRMALLWVKLFDGPRQPTIVAKLIPSINPAAPPTSDKN